MTPLASFTLFLQK